MSRRTLGIVVVAVLVVIGLTVLLVTQGGGGTDEAGGPADAAGGPADAAGDGTDGAGGDAGDEPARAVDEDGFLVPLLDEDGSVATVVADDVVVLDEQPGRLLRMTTEGDEILSLELAPDADVEVGQVLVSGSVEDIAPFGFILRVVGIEETADGRLRVAVEPAGLEDVFIQADIVASTGAWLIVDDQGIVPAAGTDRPQFGVPVAFAPDRAPPPVAPVLGYELCSPIPFEARGTVGIDAVTAAVEIGLRPCVSAQVDLDIRLRERVEGGGRVSTFELIVAVGSELGIDARIAASGVVTGSDPGAERTTAFEWTTSRPLITANTPTFKVPVGPIPVLYDVAFAVAPRAEVSGGGFEMTATLTAGLEQRIAYRSGQGWTIGGERPRSDDIDAQFFAVMPGTGTFGANLTGFDVAAVEARAEMAIDAQLRLYGLGGPTVRVAPGFSGVLPLGPGDCPRVRAVADVPVTLRFAPSVLGRGRLAAMFSWVEGIDAELARFELWQRSWPEDCRPTRHETSWSGVGGGRGVVSYDIGPIAIDERGAFDRLVGADTPDEAPFDAELTFTVSGLLDLDLSPLLEAFPLTGLGDVFRGQICDPSRNRASDGADLYSTELLLVDPVTRVITRPGRIVSGPERSTDSPYLRITDTGEDERGLCLTMGAVLDERLLRISISADLARRIRENGVVVVLAPNQSFFPIFTSFDLISANPDLWERADWSANVDGLPVLRPSE